MKTAREGGQPECGGVEWPEWPVYDTSESNAAAEVIASGSWWYGERVAQFEREFAAFQDAAFGVSCTNGTAALAIKCSSPISVGRPMRRTLAQGATDSRDW